MTLVSKLGGGKASPRSISDGAFHDARREYMERSSDSVKREQTWRTMAIVLAIGCAGLAWSNFMLAQRPAFTPYMVEVDRLGAVIPVRAADDAAKLDDRVVMNQLARFVTDMRSVFVDLNASRAAVSEAYAMLNNNTQAWHMAEAYFGAPATNPIRRGGRETVAVDIRSVIRLGGDSWRVEWTETVADRAGAITRTEGWTAILTVDHHMPTTEAAIRANPLGVYVKDIRWSKEL